MSSKSKKYSFISRYYKKKYQKFYNSKYLKYKSKNFSFGQKSAHNRTKYVYLWNKLKMEYRSSQNVDHFPFQDLPNEIKLNILYHFSVPDLTILSLVSKSMRNLVLAYVETSTGAEKIYNELKCNFKIHSATQHKKNIQNFEILGHFIRSLTCLYPIKKRIHLIWTILYMINFMPDDLIEPEDIVIDTPVRHIAFMLEDEDDEYSDCFINFAHILLSTWTKSEWSYAFRYLMKVTEMETYVAHVLGSVPGVYVEDEFKVRNFYTKIFESYYEPVDLCFWIFNFLKPYSLEHKAKLIYILFGPVRDMEIKWISSHKKFFAIGENVRDNYLYDLASPFQYLVYHPKWSTEDIVNLTNKLMCIPREWTSELKVHFLRISHPDVTQAYIENLVTKEKFVELAILINAFIVIYTRYDFSLNFLFDIIEIVCKNRDRSKIDIFINLLYLQDDSEI